MTYPRVARLGSHLGFADVNEVAAGIWHAGRNLTAALRNQRKDCAALERFPESLTEHEVEPPGEPSRVLGCAHQQLAAKEHVRAILWFVGEIELGGQQAAAARLHLHMNMASAANIDAGHDAAQ